MYTVHIEFFLIWAHLVFVSLFWALWVIFGFGAWLKYALLGPTYVAYQLWL